MSEAPPFWFRKAGLAAWALWPASLIYGQVANRRMTSATGKAANVPVLCIGNFITGGAGKTPTAIAIGKIARDMGLRPGFLSRGFGGSINQPTIVDIKTHNARDVGDEPLILALYAATVVSSDRPAGARLLEKQGVDLIIMDDGFQNPSLLKDYSLLVVDARRGMGNGFVMPAGPLRAGLKQQMALASAVLLIGKADAGTHVVRYAAKMAKPTLSATVSSRRPGEFSGQNVLAFAGIADPSKFYATLEADGAVIVDRQSFHDHHPFSADECFDLIDRARRKSLTLVTTEKDSVRLVRMGEAQQELRATSKVAHVDLEFENPKMVQLMIRAAQDKLENRSLGRSD